MGRRRRKHGKRGKDFISDLPDHLLHRILGCLESTPAAARTSVLSRRWSRVWKGLPDLFFGYERDDSDAITAALEAYSAPTVSSLVINLNRCIDLLPYGSVDAWLHFASQRLTGAFILVALTGCRCYGGSFDEIDLPQLERATSIEIDIFPGEVLLRFRSAGTFAALTELKIQTNFMEARELEALVLHCPRLTDLSVITKLSCSFPNEDVVLDVSIRSSSLKRLNIDLANVQQLHIVTPKLQVLTSGTMCDVAHISAPELVEVGVSCLHVYQFSDIGRHLRWLDIDESSVMQMRRFHTVDELRLQANYTADQYNRFLDQLNNLPKCEIFRVSLTEYDHGFVPCMLQILRKAKDARKFVMDICSTWKKICCSLTCPCRLPETSNADITFASLEEIEVDHFFSRGDDRLEFLELLLSRCSAPKLTSLRIIINWRHCYIPGKVVQKLRSMCPPNVWLTITYRM